MANELSAMGPGTVTPIVPRNIGEVFQLAEAIVNAQMSPPGLGTPQQVTVAIMQGMEVGMTPMAAVQSIAVINGRPSLYGDGLLGVVRASGLLEDLEETFDEEAMTATCSAKRKEQKTPIVRSFGKEDAIKAGLWIDDDEKDFKRQKSPWFKYRQRMCQMRARAWCLRDGFADALKGLSSAEEERDRMKDITPEVSIVGEKLTGGGGGFDAQQVDDEIEALTDPPQDAVTFEKTAGWGVIDKTVVFDATETEVTVEVGSDDAIEDTAEAHQQPEEVAEAPEPAKEEPTAGEPEVAEDFSALKLARIIHNQLRDMKTLKAVRQITIALDFDMLIEAEKDNVTRLDLTNIIVNHEARVQGQKDVVDCNKDVKRLGERIKAREETQ